MNFTPLVFFVQGYVSPSKRSRLVSMLSARVSLSNLEGSSNLFGNYNSPQIVHSSDNAGCFHISFSFSAGYKASLVQREVAARRADGGIVFFDTLQSPSQLR